MARTKGPTQELRSSMSNSDPDAVPVNSRSAAEIADLIQQLVIDEDLERGARLPSERDLAELLNSSRPTVSQAIRILVVKGLIESRHRSGAFVLRRPEEGLASAVELMATLDAESIPKLAEFRLWVETIGAVHAIECASPAGIAALAALLDDFDDIAGDVATFVRVDTAFHTTLIRMVRNPYLASVYEGVHTTLINYEHNAWIARASVPSWLRRDAQPSLASIHRPMLEALRARDPEAMRAAVLTHHLAMSSHLDAVVAEH